MSSQSPAPDESRSGPRFDLGERLHRLSPSALEVARFALWIPRVALGHPRGRLGLVAAALAAAALAWAAAARPALWPVWLGLALLAGAGALSVGVVAYVRGRLGHARMIEAAESQARQAGFEAAQAAQTAQIAAQTARLDAQQTRLSRLESALGELSARAARAEELRETGERDLRRLVADSVTSTLDRAVMIERAAEEEIQAIAGAQGQLARAVEELRERADRDRTAEEIAALRALIGEEAQRNAANARAAAELTEMVGRRIQAYRSDIAALRRSMDELRARPTGAPRAETERLSARVGSLESRLASNLETLRQLVAQAEARGEAAARQAEERIAAVAQTAEERAAALGRTLEERSAGLNRVLEERVRGVVRTAEEARAAAEAAGKQVSDLAASAREEAERLAGQAEAIARLGDEATAAAEAARQSMNAAARARNAAEETAKAAQARAAAAEQEARKAGASGDRALKLLSRMGGANAALARPFDRLVSDEVMSRLEGHWIKVLGLNLSRSSLANLAHQICLAEDRCQGRIAAPIETVLLRLLALRSLQRDSLEVLEVGTLFGIAAGVLHRLAGARETQVRLTLLDPLEGYYSAGAFDPVTGAPIERRVLEQNLQSMGVPAQDYRIIQRRSEEPEAREAACDRQYDLVVLDGDHSTAGVAHDFETYGPMVRPGGLLLFDDYGSDHWPGIKPYVDEHARTDPNWIWIGGEFRTGVMRRKQQADRDVADAEGGNIRPLRAERGAR